MSMRPCRRRARPLLQALQPWMPPGLLHCNPLVRVALALFHHWGPRHALRARRRHPHRLLTCMHRLDSSFHESRSPKKRVRALQRGERLGTGGGVWFVQVVQGRVRQLKFGQARRRLGAA